MAELTLLAAVFLAGVLRAIAGGEAPDVLAVVLPLHRVIDGVVALRQGGAAAVEEVVDAAFAHVLVLDIAEIDPDMAVLVAEQRAERQVFLALVHAPVVVVGAGPTGPCVRIDPMRRRAQGEDVQHHRLVVAHPVVVDEAAFGEPAHRDQRRALLQPAPVHALVQRVGDLADLLFARVLAVVIRLGEQHAHHQQCGVHARQLHPAVVAVALLHVQKMIVEALVAGPAGLLRPHRRVAEEFQRGQGAVDRLIATDPPVFDADRIGGQRESDRRNAGERARRKPVRRQAVDLVGGVPEKLESAAFDVRKQRRQRRLDRFGRQLRLNQDDFHRCLLFGHLGFLGLLARRHDQRAQQEWNRQPSRRVAPVHPPPTCVIDYI